MASACSDQVSCRSAGLQARIFIVDTMTRADSVGVTPDLRRSALRQDMSLPYRDVP